MNRERYWIPEHLEEFITIDSRTLCKKLDMTLQEIENHIDVGRLQYEIKEVGYIFTGKQVRDFLKAYYEHLEES